MPYLNSDVFYRHLPEEAAELFELPPRAMSAATERGELDAGPLPMADVLRLGDRLVPIGDYCVATLRESVSILFFSRVPAEELTGARVAITDHTSSSVQLLRVLFAERWLARPGDYVGLDEEHDAALVIGDPALRTRSGREGFPHVYDLGAEWYNHTRGMPFDCNARPPASPRRAPPPARRSGYRSRARGRRRTTARRWSGPTRGAARR